MTARDLAAIEWLKTRRRAGFWLGLVGFFGFLLLGLGTDYYVHVTKPATRIESPGWSGLGGFLQSIGFLVMLVTIVLLTSSEKTWRTERQNVIDGLSRHQYFLGKALLVIACALLLWLGTLLIGATFELLNRSLLTIVRLPFITSTDVLLLGGLLLYLVLVGSLGLFFATISSSSGAAIALAFVLLVAQAPMAMKMGEQGGTWHSATAYLPVQVLGSLSSRTAYDAESHAQMQTRVRENGFPLQLPAGAAAGVAVGYIALLGAGAWLSIRRRDL